MIVIVTKTKGCNDNDMTGIIKTKTVTVMMMTIGRVIMKTIYTV